MPKLLMIVVIVIGGAVVMYRWPGASPLTFNSTRGIAKVEPAPESTEKPADKAAERKVSRPKATASAVAAQQGRAPNEATSPVPVPVPVQATPAPIVSSKPELPFPTPETLRKGSTASEVRSRFGAPAIDIAGTSEGRVQERYYYLNRDKNRLTVVTLENGILISANSLSNPYFQLPSARESGLPSPPR